MGANNAKIVQSIITCLIQGTPEFWPAVKEQLTKDGHSNSEPLLKELFGNLITEASIKISEFIKNEESKKLSGDFVFVSTNSKVNIRTYLL